MNNTMEKVKMKRHESFSIREGWLTKGLLSLKKDNKVFSSPDSTDILGIGTNMVKSLKYWMFATCLIKEEKKQLEITELGELILKYDPYFEDEFTWWILHVFMILNIEDAYIFNCFFNKCNNKNFSKNDLYDTISSDLNSKKLEYNSNILQDEINMVIKTYCIDESNDNPENNFSCPFSDLELLKKNSKDNYEKIKPDYRKLHYLIVYYLIELVMGNREYISIDELLRVENGPIKILNLDKNLLNYYLDDMKRMELIAINRTAGLNMIYILKTKNISEIFEDYFAGGNYEI